MKKITEKDGLQKEWYERAEKQTLETLPEFLRELTEDYGHDYGTICYAVAAAAIGAAYAVDKSPTGGITGFQAGCVMWEFIRGWMSEYRDKPLRLINYEHLLYPQYEEQFSKTITPETWEWLQKKAAEKTGSAHPDVIAHWQSIKDGNVPFGFAIKETA